MTEHKVGTQHGVEAMSLLAAPVRTMLFLSALVVVAWAVTVQRMQGMDAGPGADLGGLGWYVGIWVTMTAAMMLPSQAPAALLLARLRRGLPTLLFLAGYLAVWTAFGLAAYAFFRSVTSFDTGWLAWAKAGPYVAGGAIVAAGVYELTLFKRHFLRRCRALHTDGPALRSGLANGLRCVGCSGNLMVVLFALGVMSVLWMVVVAVVIFAEKVLPQGLRLSRAVAIALLALGIWVAFAPSTAPGLTEPGMAPSMEMQP